MTDFFVILTELNGSAVTIVIFPEWEQAEVRREGGWADMGARKKSKKGNSWDSGSKWKKRTWNKTKAELRERKKNKKLNT